MYLYEINQNEIAEGMRVYYDVTGLRAQDSIVRGTIVTGPGVGGNKDTISIKWDNQSGIAWSYIIYVGLQIQLIEGANL